MKIHKEGYKILIVLAIFLAIINAIVFWLIPNWLTLSYIITGILFLLVLQFFRSPWREIMMPDDNLVYAPADGKIVAIEEVKEDEYFEDKRIQVSIFMSPTNVHVNRNPIGGTVNYFRYHPGKYLVAWHPKASTENERTTIVVENQSFGEVLYRQIAGALAKRIVNYAVEGEKVEQGTDAGFIKFGSRVDVFLPIGTTLKVGLGDTVKGGVQVIAEK